MKISPRVPILILARLSQVYGELYQLLTSSNTTSLLDTILSRGYLKVGTTGDYKPFSYAITNTTRFPSTNTTNSTTSPRSFNTSFIGADIDAAQALSNALNLPYPAKFVPTIWANLTKDINAGKFDIAMGGITITLERAKTAFFSQATQRAGKVACIRCSDARKFTSRETLDREGVIVVVNPGGTNEKFDRANLSRATIKVVDDNNAVFQAVLDGEGDAMITDFIEVELQMKVCACSVLSRVWKCRDPLTGKIGRSVTIRARCQDAKAKLSWLAKDLLTNFLATPKQTMHGVRLRRPTIRFLTTRIFTP